MRKFITLALVAAAPALFAAPTGASATAQASASVNIVAPIYLTSNMDLNFGTVLVEAYDTAAQVTLVGTSGAGTNPVVQETYTKCASYGTSTASAAFFHYKKDKRYDVNVAIDKTIDLGDKVSVATTNDLPSDSCGYFGSLPSSVEAKHFSVGGVLSIPANTFGEKSGKFNVVVAYK